VGVPAEKIHRVGNIMIDSLITMLDRMGKPRRLTTLQELDLAPGEYVLVTLHRPSNVDDPARLARILDQLERLAARMPVVFPMHPRTRKIMDANGMHPPQENRLRIIEPVRYGQFIALQENSRFVLTDSGGIQEESTFFGLPCLTLRPNTERPITITEGTNELVTIDALEAKCDAILAGRWKTGRIPALWDGGTAERITQILQASDGQKLQEKR
jgi:UDP-N-acetylglucosamine 2-epimerase (non-hydrolysing)